MLIKDAPALRVKVADVDADGGTEGEFTALVSVFGNIDSYGDVVQPGAFDRSLREWSASGYPIPVYWGHNLSDPDYNIGHVVEAVETDRGLQVRAQLDMDSPKAPQVYRLLKGGRVKEFSFGYSVRDAGWGEKDDREVYELRDIDLYEVSVVPVGANPATELHSVKAHAERTARSATRALEGVKAGRVLSAKNEDALREARNELAAAIDTIDGVLSALDPPAEEPEEEADEKKSQEQTPATEQEPDPDKDDDEQSSKSGAPMPDFAAASLEARISIKKRSAQ